MSNRPVHFLSYLNRSGSTLLAKKLNSFRDIAVGIEERLGDEARENCLINNDDDLQRWLDFTYADYKFMNWGLERSQLEAGLIDHGYPLCYKDFLKVALNIYYEDNPAKVLLHKGIGLFHHLDKSERIYPKHKYVFVDRDPRAIFNSQSKSVDSYTNEVMCDDVYAFAYRYKTLQTRIHYYGKSPQYRDKFLVVRYEEFVENEDRAIASIMDFFQLSTNRDSNDDGEYLEKIPSAQHHLHQNLKRGNSTSRINAWQQELNSMDLLFLQSVLRRELKRNGYSLSSAKVMGVLQLIFLWAKVVKFHIFFYPKAILKSMLVDLGIRSVF